MSKTSKLQSATEYLVTYSWAFAIIMIVLVSIYYLGILNPGSSLSQECVFSSTLNCLKYQLYSNGTLTFNIQQNSLDTISISSVGCSANTTSLIMTSPANAILVQADKNFTDSVTCYSSNGQPYLGSVGSVFSGTLEINYSDAQTGLQSSNIGKLVVKVSD